MKTDRQIRKWIEALYSGEDDFSFDRFQLLIYVDFMRKAEASIIQLVMMGFTFPEIGMLLQLVYIEKMLEE